MNKLRLGYSEKSSYLLELTPLHDYFDLIPLNWVKPNDLCFNEILDPVDTGPNPTIVNNIFEQTREYNGNELHLTGQWFFWAHEYYINTNYKKDQIETFSKSSMRLALMPIGKTRDHRTQTLEVLEEFLNNMYWSQRELGKSLPFDEEGSRDRFVQPLWYQDTFCSVVCETAVLGPEFITEKTFKPIAFEHPFLIIGTQHILQSLREQGFATFDNIFDESYANEEDVEKRIYGVRDNLRRIEHLEYDNETVERIKHNRAHFYNKQRVDEIIINEIVNPILEYAETR
jgi:hypothetical protein